MHEFQGRWTKLVAKLEAGKVWGLCVAGENSVLTLEAKCDQDACCFLHTYARRQLETTSTVRLTWLQPEGRRFHRHFRRRVCAETCGATFCTRQSLGHRNGTTGEWDLRCLGPSLGTQHVNLSCAGTAHLLAVTREVAVKHKCVPTRADCRLEARLPIPLIWHLHRYSIEHGAVFGLSHSLDQLAYFRPGTKTDVGGFYLVGASARPGNGVPLVMISADQAARRVLQDLEMTN